MTHRQPLDLPTPDSMPFGGSWKSPFPPLHLDCSSPAGKFVPSTPTTATSTPALGMMQAREEDKESTHSSQGSQKWACSPLCSPTSSPWSPAWNEFAPPLGPLTPMGGLGSCQSPAST